MTTSRRSAGCSPSASVGCRSPVRRLEVNGLELVAEGAGGRRNRIDTVLVRRLSRDDALAQAEAQVDSA